MAENIYTLINKVMSDIGAVGKASRNTQQGYSFRGIDDLYGAVQPALVKYGVFYVTNVEKIEQSTKESKSGGLLTCTVLTVSFTFYAPDSSSIVVRTVGEGMDSGDKSCSKAMSTALKYALLQLFCIPTSEPKDSEHDSPEPVYNKREYSSVDKKTGEVTVPKSLSGQHGVNSGQTKDQTLIALGTTDEPDWGELVTIGREFHWPAPYVKQWINDQKKAGEDFDAIYARGMAKFSIANKAKQFKEEDAEV
jgi:hypothetical protein